MGIKKLILKFGVISLKGIYAPMKLRRTRNRITIISRQSDEPTVDIALLSDYIRKKYPHIECCIMCRKLEKKGALGYGLHMMAQMASIAVSKVVVLDGYCIAASVLDHKKELSIIQMWHSMAAIKAFGYQAVGKEEGRSPEIVEIFHMHRNYDYIIAPSETTGRFFAEAFNADEKKLRYFCLPRTDIIQQDMITGVQTRSAGEELGITSANSFRNKVRCEYGIRDDQEIILYAPTFRKSEEVDVKPLQEAIDESKYKLIIKLHPLYDRTGYSDKNYSTYDWFRVCDRIITDYSAIGLEAALIGKPVYYYVYDIERYKERVGLNVDLREEIPQATAENPQDLKRLIEEDYDYKALEVFRDKYISADRTRCTEKLGDFICSLTAENL
ncbi:MAG: CDP-glycerol glycerophosphotransferase family protein [Bacillota bacterium]|nr:CDP-glycerol glycerophosphotransferase family protein [Bacillota bacterium]